MRNDELPEGWSLTTLGEVTRPSSEKIEPQECPNAPYLSLEHIESQSGRILGYGNGSDVRSTKSVFRAGNVLYGKLRPYLNKVSVPDFDGICSTDMLVFPRSPWLENRYLSYFLSCSEIVEFANHHSSGVQLPRIGFDKLAELAFPLPPLAEQKRIVAKVEELLARVNAARERLARVPTILKRFRQAVLATACSGRLSVRDGST
jgi:type I restriction enzyme S subunit